MYKSSQFRSIQTCNRLFKAASFRHKNVTIEQSDKKQRIPSDPSKLEFGNYFTNHMVQIDWDERNGWFDPMITPFEDIKIHPAAKCLHYGIQLFEGLKAYHGVDGKIRMFRPDQNMERMRRSARRLCLPDFDVEQSLLMLDEFVRVEADMIPKTGNGSLYLRPMFFATEPQIRVCEPLQAKWACFGSPVGNYFDYGEKGLTLLADPRYVRSWPGGVGQYKIGGNYAPTILVAKMAAEKKCDQVLWLSGENQLITEAGAMNIFMLWRNEDNELELITPPTSSGLLLPGITRQSVLELAREWNEFKVSEKDFTMDQLVQAIKDDRVEEFFVAGTAALLGPVSEFVYNDSRKEIIDKLPVPTCKSKHGLWKRLYDTITSIQYGKIERKGWQRIVNM